MAASSQMFEAAGELSHIEDGFEDSALLEVSSFTEADVQAEEAAALFPSSSSSSASKLRGMAAGGPARSKKCPSYMGLSCSGRGDCDAESGRCKCRKPFRGSRCQFDMGKMRPVWLGCHLQPLPAHVSDVCASALGDQNRCPGYRLLQYKLCADVCPLVEGSNCAAENIVKACEDPLIKCPALVSTAHQLAIASNACCAL